MVPEEQNLRSELYELAHFSWAFWNWFPKLILLKNINDPISNAEEDTGSLWHAIAKHLLKLSPADTCSYEPIEGKTLNDQLFAAIHFSKNKEFNGGWLVASE